MKLSYLFLVVFCCISARAFSETVDTVWVRLYNGPGNGDDRVTKLRVDGSGNIYAAGNSGGGAQDYDYAVIKYKPNGDTAWVRRYNGAGNSYDFLTDMVTDNSGNVYVTGSSWGSSSLLDYATIKYSTNGTLAWLNTYNGPANDTDGATAITINSLGNICVTGSSQDSSNNRVITSLTYAPNGNSVWSRTFHKYPSDYVNSIAADDSGNVYINGASPYSTFPNDSLLIIKYTPSGDTVWTKRLIYSGGHITYSKTGYLYVTRFYGLRKFLLNGDTLWGKSYTPPGSFLAGPQNLAVDNSDNAYITGISGTLSGDDIATTKFLPNGDSAWLRTYSSPINGSNIGTTVAVDGQGNVYVAGRVDLGGVNGWDIVTIKYLPDGDTAWTAIFSGPGTSDEAFAMAVDNSGYVYVGGQFGGDFITIKYSQCQAMPGDANANSNLSLADIIATVNYIFAKPGWPVCAAANNTCWLSGLICRGDWDGTATVTLSDVIRGVNYLFARPGGPWNPVPVGTCCLP